MAPFIRAHDYCILIVDAEASSGVKSNVKSEVKF